jgi:hypothetical protein
MIILIESANPANIQEDGRKLWLESVFLKGDVVNKNNRFYRADPVLSNAVDAIQEQIKMGNMFGHAGHQSSASGNPMAISHVVKSLRRRGSDWIGRARIIDDDGAGKKLAAIARAGGRLGISVAGTGTTTKRKDGVDLVNEDYRILHFDAVTAPSSNHFFDVVVESILEETAAETSHRGNKLSKENLRSRAEQIANDIIAKLSTTHPELAAAQRAHAIPFDDTMGRYQAPTHFDETMLDILERDRANLVQRLLQVQREIAAQNNAGSAQDKYAAYAKQIAATSDPLKKSSLKREAARQIYSDRLLEATCKLLARGSGNLQVNAPNTMIEDIRRRSGSRDSTKNELDAINEYNKRNRR